MSLAGELDRRDATGPLLRPVQQRGGEVGSAAAVGQHPHAEGAHFDMGYYARKHMPMVRERLGEALRGISIDRGLAGGARGAPALYIALGLIGTHDAHRRYNRHR